MDAIREQFLKDEIQTQAIVPTKVYFFTECPEECAYPLQ